MCIRDRLYGLFNAQQDVWCERVFMPDGDMEALLREKHIPLFALESRDPIKDFDFVGFTLQYEMSYTTILHMLDLAGIPLRAADREEGYPLIVGGGPCACNPEPVADFFDLFTLGEGEEAVSYTHLDVYKRQQYGHRCRNGQQYLLL